MGEALLFSLSPSRDLASLGITDNEQLVSTGINLVASKLHTLRAFFICHRS